MEHTRILTKVPGETVYASKKNSEVYHAFTDTYGCPCTQQLMEIPGKGIINHHISSFLFSTLESLHVPTHFIRMVNARESLMHSANSLPFEVTLRCAAEKGWAQLFSSEEKKVFDPPLMEYKLTQNRRFISESLILTLEWLNPDTLDALHLWIIKVAYFLQGIFIKAGLNLMDVTFSIGQSYCDDFFLMGQLSPETLCLFDPEMKQYLGSPYIMSGEMEPIMHYKTIASRLGVVWHKSERPCVIPFKKPPDRQ